MSAVFLSFFNGPISLPYKRNGRTSALYVFILETSEENIAYRCCLEFPLYEKMLLVLVEYSFLFH